MSRIDLPKIYNPAIQTPEELIDNFVVRTALFEEIFKDIKTSKMSAPEQHYIIRGIRGQGKTTLLLRLTYEIAKDKQLKKRLIPVCFNEEQYNISRLFKLWETVADHLRGHKGFNDLHDRMQRLDDDDDYEARCFELLEAALKTNKKKLVLLIDNIDDILNKFSKTELQRLREVFTECAEIRVVGASAGVLEFHHKYTEPFYEFFKTPMLKGLTTDETRTLLLKLSVYYKKDEVAAIVNDQPGRVESLRRITGGVIRTIVIMFQMFADDPDGRAFLDLETILDSVTPLYKERMDRLSAQHQEIVDCIALNWDAITAGEIAKKTRIPSKAVSAQLKQLEKYHIIEKVRTSTKNNLYRIAERFFNIWYLMRHGRKWDEKRVRFLVEFLQMWCDQVDLKTRALSHLQSLKENRCREKQALYMAEALSRTSIDRDLQQHQPKNGLAWSYFEQQQNKARALEYAESAFEQSQEPHIAHTYASILLWHDMIEKAVEVSGLFLSDKKFIETHLKFIEQFLMLLIAKKQYHTALNIFNDNPGQLRDRLKPVYYALTHFLKNELPDEWRKMGDELKETVDEVINEIRRMEKEYD